MLHKTLTWLRTNNKLYQFQADFYQVFFFNEQNITIRDSRK